MTGVERRECGMAQLEAREPHKLEVAGSSPAPATTIWQDGAPPSGPKLRAGPTEKRGNPSVSASSTGATTRAASGRVSEEGTRDERVNLFVKVAAVLLLTFCAQGCALAEWMMEKMVTWGVGTLTGFEKTPGGGVP